MFFESLNRAGGRLTKGNLVKKIRDGGSYKSNRDFFSVHWEIQHKRPNCVLFHIEAPRYSDDEGLNNLKAKTIETLLRSDIKALIEGEGYFFKEGAKKDIANFRRNKSSEAFRIELTDDQVKELIILGINTKFGNKVTFVLEEIEDELKGYF